MKTPLHILHLEDDPIDAALVQSVLEAGGVTCAITCVQGRDEFMAVLERGEINLVLSDYSLPAFDGLSALEIVRAGWPDVPLIFVSGTLGEERAINSLKGGATDYVLKERLGRLVPAVRRALKEVEERAERVFAERKREEYSRKLQCFPGGWWKPRKRSAGALRANCTMKSARRLP
ncbi:MAG: response regulator [Limisphaerales bacterium]